LRAFAHIGYKNRRASGMSGNLPGLQATKLVGARHGSWYTKKGSF
jgi:hypothetical protein